MVAGKAQAPWRCGSIIESMAVDVDAANVGTLKRSLQVPAGTQ